MITLTKKVAGAFIDHVLDDEDMTPEDRERIETPAIAITHKCHPGQVAVVLRRTADDQISISLECIKCDEAQIQLILGDDPQYEDQPLPNMHNLEETDKSDVDTKIH